MLSRSYLYALEEHRGNVKVYLRGLAEDRRRESEGPQVTNRKTGRGERSWSSPKLCRLAEKVIRISNERSKPDI
jgi:hypothetical protein